MAVGRGGEGRGGEGRGTVEVEGLMSTQQRQQRCTFRPPQFVHVHVCVCVHVCLCLRAALTVSGLAAVLLQDLEEDSRVVSLNCPRVVLGCFVRQEEAG